MQNRTGPNSSGIDLRPTEPDECIYRLLESNNLPTEAIDSPDVTLYEATCDNTRIGFGSYEFYDSTALLRSIIVDSEMRGQGIGTSICIELEDSIACKMGERIYILTTEAVEFFEKIGYEQADPTSAPRPIQNRQQFTEHSPTSTVCMKKSV